MAGGGCMISIRAALSNQILSLMPLIRISRCATLDIIRNLCRRPNVLQSTMVLE
jgi:hypothetical protein